MVTGTTTSTTSESRTVTVVSIKKTSIPNTSFQSPGPVVVYLGSELTDTVLIFRSKMKKLNNLFS